MSSSVKSPGDRLVDVIITEDHFAVMNPAVAILEPVLQYRRKSYAAGGPLGYQEIEEDVSLCEFDRKGRLCFAAGLLPRVRRVLREHGYRVRVNDQREPGPRLQVDQRALDGADGNKPLMRAVAREPLGRIEAHTDKEILDKMLLIAQMFPEARVVVATATRKEAWKCWRELESCLEDEVGLAISGVRRDGGRWLVGTFGSVPRREAGEYDILLLPHGEVSTGERAVEMVAEMEFKRIYAFVRPQRRPDRIVQLRLEQMAGPIIHHAKKPRVPVRVLVLPTPACEVENYQSALERKRLLYWQNQGRNEYVAAVAKAVVTHDRAALKHVGLRNKDIRVLNKCAKDKAVVLVESPEHGRELLPLLQGWRMLDMVGEDANKGLESDKNDADVPTVMTAAYAAMKGTEAHVVVRATGTEWAMRIKGFPHKEGKHTPNELLVIDFRDEFHAAAVRDAERRVVDYERRGMKVVITQTSVT